jgi:hypothetical protein
VVVVVVEQMLVHDAVVMLRQSRCF